MPTNLPSGIRRLDLLADLLMENLISNSVYKEESLIQGVHACAPEVRLSGSFALPIPGHPQLVG